MMQLFNQVSCRIIDDNLNIIFRIETNYTFFLITGIEAALQIIIIEVTGIVFKVCNGVININKIRD